LEESTIRKILAPVLLGVYKTTHRVTYKTSMGVVKYVSIPLGSGLPKYTSAGISGTLQKISLWNLDDTEELEEMLRSKGIEMIQIVKDGQGMLELKK
jgi:hypothetical protein